jgi:argininosuccinate lyase
MELKSKRLAAMREEVLSKEGPVYPGHSLANWHHKKVFETGRGRGLDILMAIHKAHLVMLAKQKIIEPEDVKAIKKALLEMPVEDLRKIEFDEKSEDMFFYTESWMIKHVGDCAGNLHIARSRNDIGSTSQRMELREDILTLMEAINKLYEGLLEFAAEHRDTLMCAYTHTQQAQPTTMGHYISGLLEVLARDQRRLKNAYITVNESPLGAAAITTSGFPIDREIVRNLLGFDTIQQNAYDCIAASDFLSEAAGAVSSFSLNLGRFINNLMVWSAEEYGFLKTRRIYVGISSIMPQKRNPTAFEHLKSFLSGVFGDCQAALVMQHNTTYEDVLDPGDSMGHIINAINESVIMCHLLYNIMVTMDLDKEVLRRRALESFSVMTEFADMLVREEKISFRQGHHVASELAEVCSQKKLTISQVSSDLIAEVFQKVTGRPLKVSQDKIRKSLDAQYFVDIRIALGGPAPKPMDDLLARERQLLEQCTEWVSEKRKSLEDAGKRREEALRSL